MIIPTFSYPTFEEYFYRIEDKLCAGSIDEFDNCGPAQVHVQLYKYGVIKHTKCGTWVNVYGEKKFVLRDARKRFACATIAEAKEQFTWRKERQMSILYNKIHNIELAISKLYQIKEV